MLGQVVGVGDGLVLRLGRFLSGVLSGSILLLGLGNGLTGLLILQLGLALNGTRGGGSLVGSTMK